MSSSSESYDYMPESRGALRSCTRFLPLLMASGSPTTSMTSEQWGYMPNPSVVEKRVELCTGLALQGRPRLKARYRKTS